MKQFLIILFLVTSLQAQETAAPPADKAAQDKKPQPAEQAAKGITIIKALYGSTEQFASGEEWDVTEIAKTRVVDGKLHIYHTRNAFGDPHPYKAKMLKITYLVDGKNDLTSKPYEHEQWAGKVELSADNQNIADAVADGVYPPFNHVFQGPGTTYCGQASLLMALQRITSLDLKSPSLLPAIGGVYRQSASRPSGLTNCFEMAQILGLNPKLINYDTSKLTEKNTREFVLSKLNADIIPELEKGKLVFFALGTKNRKSAHYVLLSFYNKASLIFRIHDPLKLQSEWWSIEKVAAAWPATINEKLYIYGAVVDIPQHRSDVLVYPAETVDLHISPDSLKDLEFPAGISIPQLNSQYVKSKFIDVIKGARVIPVSTYWEAGKKIDSYKSVSTWLKIKAAQGQPVCLFYAKDSGERVCVAVSGYKGGLNNFDGELQISELNQNGEVVKSWVSCEEVLRRGATTRICRGDAFFIIYPDQSIVAPAVTETNNDSK